MHGNTAEDGLQQQPVGHGYDRATAASAPAGHWCLAWQSGGARAPCSVLVDRRAFLAALLLLLGLLAASFAYLTMGSSALAPRAVLPALVGRGDLMAVFLVQELRLPRLLAACLTGAAFGVAGCLMQTLARNRLATPGIIGIDNGATAFAVASVIGLGVSLAPPAMALVGATTAAALTFGLAAGGGTRGYRFIVAGIGVGAVFGAITQLLLAKVHIDTANAAYPWTVGSLNARPAGAVTLLAVGLPLGLGTALWLTRALSLMRFSDAVAAGLGLRVSQRRWQVLAVSVLLTGLAVSVAGPVGLVGLIGPEIARSLSSPRGVPVMASALAGALVMVLADLAGRVLLSPIEIPVGIVTAVVGGPWLLWILLRPASRNLA
ncbi:iron ABC transporter permease [Halomonas daqingensis]|uniref:Iron ABC transporter permease n=1 Tax=Billgrantia desiderata TaxID=52021 RepID=A0AAW4YTM6_9GAMM|nr:iron ABC transporter permease [Halomonas desiderata]MCE8044137.1 iron ABC transporter permease [Halomonas desiderata]MCE8048711.1 iron ABC transporter permease [Halomonas desiderata]MCE8052042.1 iron ABC transporter permease [Halomonas desiderata]